MKHNDFAKQIESIAELSEPTRRKLYLYVVGRAGDVSRDEAAKGTGISRALTAFHLDCLVDAGLLEATFRRLSARTGPGAGRPSKLYRRSSARLDVSVPQRRYELAAQILTQTLAGFKSENGAESLRTAAREWGKNLAQEIPKGGRLAPMNRAVRALRRCGFEPSRTPDGEVVLRNCPFDSLRATNRQLICGMNLALIEGLIDGLDIESVRARLAPREKMCCVALRKDPEAPERDSE